MATPQITPDHTPAPNPKPKRRSKSLNRTKTPKSRQSNDPANLFSAKVEDVRSMIKLVRTIHVRDMAYFSISEQGFKITIEESNSFQISACINQDNFEGWMMKQPSITFKMNLRVVLECLQVFGGNQGTRAQIYLEPNGEKFGLMMQEVDLITECRLRTDHTKPVEEIEFRTEAPIFRMICKSDCIREAFHELQAFPIKNFTLYATAAPPYLRFVAKSDDVTSEVTIAKDSDYMETYESHRDVNFQYRSLIIKSALRALHLSDKTSMRVDKRGVMALQFLIRGEDEKTSFVELFCLPEQEMPDDDD